MGRLTCLVALTTFWLMAPHRVLGQSAARAAGYRYLSPVPGAPYVSAQTRYVLLRFESIAPSQVTNLTTDFISVNGITSGTHSGTTRVASDNRTVLFEMSVGFAANETVTVTLNPQVARGLEGRVIPFQYQFTVTAPENLLDVVHSKPVALPTNGQANRKPAIVKRPSRPEPVKKSLVLSNGVSVPSDFPQVVITVNSNPSPGYLFLENALDAVAPYTMMLDNNGLPVWYRRGRMFDFKIQKNGMITWALSDDTGFPAFDQNFNYLKTYLTSNGYWTDSHDLKVLADGTYFMIGYQNSAVDMSQYIPGGPLDAVVHETVVQEFTPEGDLILQWRAWDNYNIADENGNTDFPHINGIDIDDDGNLLVSARHLSEITKVDRDSGEIIWRLSGAHSSFAFVNDPLGGTSYQHNISALGNGHYMVFDNGDYHTPMVSRAVEYELDLTNMTATVAWQFRDTPDKFTYYLGSAQRLPTGNTLIDFVLAQYPKAIEVDSKGVKHFELSLVPEADSYRAFRFPWNGVVAAPYLIVEQQVDNVTLIFNKFGDHTVAYYRIYAGLAPHPTTLLAESATTLKELYNLQNTQYYFRVTAVSTNGIESPFSNEERLYVNTVAPGQNTVSNGDFSAGAFAWAFQLNGSAQATWSVTNAVGDVSITNGSMALSDIQLTQGGQPLVQGRQYVLSFDAWASQPRYIGVELASSASSGVDYSRIVPPFLTPNLAHYRYVFMMQQPSNFSAELVFNLGTIPGNIYLDNVVLYQVPPGDLNLDGHVDFLDLKIFSGKWLKVGTGLPGDLNGDGQVDFNDFSILGQNWFPAVRQ